MIAKRVWRISAAAALLAAGGASAAAGGDADGWRLTPGAFGTLGAVYHAEDDIEYRRDTSQPHGAEADQLDLETDSLLGLQLNVGYGQQLEAVAQVISKLRPDNSWEPHLSRGFVRYVPDPSLMLRLGRVTIGLYPRLDSRDVGYSYLTIRPAVEAYGYFASDRIDGGDLQWTHPVGDALWRVKAYFGRAKPMAVPGQPTPAFVGGGASLDVLHHGWQFRIGGAMAELRDELADNPLVEPLRSSGSPQAIALAGRMADPGDRLHQIVSAAAHDGDHLQLELLVQRIWGNGRGSFDAYNGYASLGYRLGKFTPFSSFAMIDSVRDILATGLDAPAYAQLNEAAYTAQVASGAASDRRTWSLGLRYELAPSFDLKLQIDRVRAENSQLLIDRRADPRRDVEMTVFGVALDFAL